MFCQFLTIDSNILRPLLLSDLNTFRKKTPPGNEKMFFLKLPPQNLNMNITRNLPKEASSVKSVKMRISVYMTRRPYINVDMKVERAAVDWTVTVGAALL